MKNILAIIAKIGATLLITLLLFAATILTTVKMICSDISESAKELFATTMLETGQMKFLATMFLSGEEVQRLVNGNSVSEMKAEVNTNLITGGNKDINGIELKEISGHTFFAKLLIVNDPSRVRLSTIYPWRERGEELAELVRRADAIAGVNGGLYLSKGNSGGRPLGLCVCNGEIQLNEPTGIRGLYLIGLDRNNILRIIDLDGKKAPEIESIIKKEEIRDAVAFQEEASDKNNHFVKLIVNGEVRHVEGRGSGANPRTAIGQRADGAIMFLVTDGRGASGHLGATAADLIKVMKENGAVNAANIDGGSSSTMYYKDKYEMTSVTFYYANSSWKLPTAFVVMTPHSPLKGGQE